jgi:hypothetical protein
VVPVVGVAVVVLKVIVVDVAVVLVLVLVVAVVVVTSVVVVAVTVVLVAVVVVVVVEVLVNVVNVVRVEVPAMVVCVVCVVPSVFGRNLQCAPVRKWTPEKNAIGHTPARLKRACAGTNGILECKFLSKNARRACG